MSGLRNEDFLMRQVRMMAEIIARITGLRRGGRAPEAAAELERAYGELLGPQTDLVRRFDPATAATLVGEPERVLVLARLCREEAAQAADPSRRAYLALRACALGLEAARRVPDGPEIREFLAEIAPEVPRDALTAEQQETLAAVLGSPP